MNEELLSSSDKYLKKSNRMLLVVGIVALLAFLIGVIVLISGGEKQKEDAKVTIDGSAESSTGISGGNADAFNLAEDAAPPQTVRLVVSPDTLKFDQVVLGTTAEGTLTLSASSGKVGVISVEFESKQEEGFVLDNKCRPNDILTGDVTCNVVVRWQPKTARTIQSNLSIRWRDESFGIVGKKVIVPISAMAIDTSMCGVCDEAPGGGSTLDQLRKKGRVILGPDGKPIGYADENGVVYGLDGKRIGTLRADGTVVDDQGYVIGVAEGTRIALGPNGEIIGTILPDSRVIDKDGKLIGYALPDGTIVDLNGNVIGAAVQTGIAYDKYGNRIGRIMPDGTVVDDNGNVIGYLNPDGTIVDKDGNIIGSVAPQGAVVGPDGKPLGIVLPDGTVVDKDGNIIGRVLPNGFVVDKDGNIIGRVVKEGLAIGPGCKMIGRVSSDGSVMLSNKQVGRLTPSMTIVDLSGNPIGGYVQEGALIDWNGKIIGKVDSDGQPVDQKGTVLGCLSPTGKVLNDSEEIIAAVLPKGTVVGNHSCGVKGQVMPDGSVVGNGNLVGRILPDGTLLSSDGKIDGALARQNVGVAPGCKSLGFVNLDGKMITTKGVEAGCLTANGDVLDEDKVVLGRVLPDVVYVNAEGRFVGMGDGNGKLLDKKGEFLGCVDPSGVALSKEKPVGMLRPSGGVLDRNGRTIGWVMPDGGVSNIKGAPAGTVLPDSTVVDLNGRVVAKVAPTNGYALRGACQIVGRILEDGRVVDDKFKRVASVKSDYSLVNEKGGFAGRVVFATGGVGKKNDYLGYVADDGALTDAAGNKVGCLRPDTLFVDASNKFMGGPLYEGIAVDKDAELYARGDSISKALNLEGSKFIGNVTLAGLIKEKNKITGGIVPLRADVLDVKTSKSIGRLLPDGSAIDNAGRVMGHLRMPAGEIIDKDKKVVGKIFVGLRLVVGSNGEILGVVMFDGSVVDAFGRVIGKAFLDGKVVDENGNVIGEVLPVGQPVLGPDGKIIGYVGEDGTIVDENGNPVLGPNGKPMRYRAGGSIVEESGKVIGKVGGQLERLVYDENGNVIGRVLPDGTVVDLNGKVIGKMLPDGTVVDLNGKVIGRAGPPERLAYDKDGRLIGRVLADGTVVDFNGKVIGRVLADGTIVDLGGRIVGYTVKEGIAIGFDNALIGHIDADGHLKDIDTQKIKGSLLPDDTVVDEKYNQIGRGIINAIPVGRQCRILGTIDDRGRVTDSSGREAGKLTFDRAVLNFDNYQIGYAVSPDAVVGNPCEMIGRVTAEGKAVDIDGKEIGCVDFEGLVVDKNGKRLGRLVQKGQVRGPDDKVIGKVVSSGEVLNNDGTVIGCFAQDGSVVDKSKKIVGVAADLKYAVDDKGKLIARVVGNNYGVSPESGVLVGTTDGGTDVKDASKKKMASVLPAGRRVIREDGKIIGTLLPKGQVVSDGGEALGYATSSLRVLSNDQKFLGRVVPIGEVCKDMKDKPVGTVHFDGTIINDKQEVLGRLMASGQAIANSGAHLCTITLMSVSDDGSLFPKDLIGQVVYGADGKPLGTIGADGFIRDANGNIIGRVLPDGTIVDVNGNVLGKAYPKGTVLDANGNVIGRVLPDGTVVDLDGNVIGKMLADGTVVDLNGNVIGRALLKAGVVDSKGNIISKGGEERLVYDANGNVIGRVLPDGTVVDMNGNVIGKMLPDGTVVDLNGNTIGRADSVAVGAPKHVKIAVGRDGKMLGIVGEDGYVRDAKGNIIGRVLPDGTVVDLNGNIIGSVMEGEALLDENGNIIGVIMADGRVMDLNGVQIGRINANGEIVDENGIVLGTWRGGRLTANSDKLKSRFAFGKDGKRIGTILPDGRVVDENGNIIGRVNEKGGIVDLNGNVIGYAESESGGATGTGTDKKDDGKVSVFGAFDPDAYRYRGKYLGAGGGTGKGERYDPARIKELRAKQLAVRRTFRPGTAGTANVSSISILDRQKKAKNWKKQGIEKSVSSYRVDMSRMILADKAIPAVLIRSVDTENTDVPVSAAVERNIYSETGRKIIIPAGSRVIGELDTGSDVKDVASATKVSIKWTRLIRPDGAAFSFSEGASGDASGRAGIGAYVDRQLTKRYGLPLLGTSVSSGIQYLMSSNKSPTVGQDGEVALSDRQQAAQDARTTFGDQMKQIFDDIFTDTKNIATRLFVPSGTRITIFAREDLWLRSETEDQEEGHDAEGLLDEDCPNGSCSSKLQKEKNENNGDENGEAGLEIGQNSGGGNQLIGTRNQQQGGQNSGSTQQQQQIYYNNYTGGQPVNQESGGNGQLLSSGGQKQQQPAPVIPVVEEKKPEDPVPELF